MKIRDFVRTHRAEIDAIIRRSQPPAVAPPPRPVVTFSGRLVTPRRRRDTINDTDREEWIRNDEGLYAWASSEGVRP